MTRAKYNEILVRIAQLRTLKISQWEKRNPAPIVPDPITVNQRVQAMRLGQYVLADPLPEGSGWKAPLFADVVLLPEEVAYAANKKIWEAEKHKFIERLDDVISEIKDTILLEDLALLSTLLLQLKQSEV